MGKSREKNRARSKEKSKDKAKDKKSFDALQWGIPTVILMVFLVFTLITYDRTMASSAKSQALDKIGRYAIRVCGYYEGKFNTINDVAQSVVDYCIDDEEIFNQKNVSYLSSVVDSLSLVNAYIIKPDQTAIDAYGNTYLQVDNSSTFTALLEGKEMTSVIQNERGEMVILFAVPIRSEVELKGSVIFVYKPNDIENILESPSYNFTLVFSNGMVAEELGDSNKIFVLGDNLIDELKKAKFLEGSLSGMKQALETGRPGTCFVESMRGERRYLLYQPIKSYKCSVFVSVRENQIERSVSEVNSETRNLIYKILISMAIFVALVCGIYIINRFTFNKTSKELQNKAETDLLTDLLNKISTERKIKEYLEGEGKNKTCMMCVLDIDNFKKINDTMGHAFGDEVLSTLGKRIRSEFRVTDIVGRTGGDEFIIFLKDLKSPESIIREADRVASFFKNFQVGQYTKYSATASIGASIYPRDAQDYETLYKASDTALYKAKKRGKNQLAFYREEGEEAPAFITEEEKKGRVFDTPAE